MTVKKNTGKYFTKEMEEDIFKIGLIKYSGSILQINSKRKRMSKKLQKVIKRLAKRYDYEVEMCDELKNDGAFLGYSCSKLNQQNIQLRKDIKFLKGILNENTH